MLTQAALNAAKDNHGVDMGRVHRRCGVATLSATILWEAVPNAAAGGPNKSPWWTAVVDAAEFYVESKAPTYEKIETMAFHRLEVVMQAFAWPFYMRNLIVGGHLEQLVISDTLPGPALNILRQTLQNHIAPSGEMKDWARKQIERIIAHAILVARAVNYGVHLDPDSFYSREKFLLKEGNRLLKELKRDKVSQTGSKEELERFDQIANHNEKSFGIGNEELATWTVRGRAKRERQ